MHLLNNFFKKIKTLIFTKKIKLSCPFCDSYSLICIKFPGGKGFAECRRLFLKCLKCGSEGALDEIWEKQSLEKHVLDDVEIEID